MKRLIWCAAILMLSLAVIAPAAAQANGTILQLTIPVFLEDILQPVIDQYQAENPGVQVLLVPYQGFGVPVEASDDPEVYLDNLASYYSSADVLLVDSSLTPTATRAGYLLDLSPLTGSDPDFNESEFEPALLPAFNWDNGQWALPISTSFVVVEYIPEAFDAAGLAYPTANWTLADLESAARALTQYNADGTVALPGMLVLGGGGNGGNNLAQLFLSLLGHGVYSDSTFPASPALNDPTLASLLDAYAQMQADGILTLPQGTNNNLVPLTIGNPQQGFGGGPFGGQNQVEKATALLPGGFAGLTTTGYAVSNGTHDPEAAYNLVKYLIHNRNAVAASFGNVPAVRDLPEATQTGPGNGGPGGGPGGGGGGRGGFLGNALTVPDSLQPLLNDALTHGMATNQQRFADGISTAWNLMQSDSLDAQTALEDVQATLTAELTAADARRAGARIVVQDPTLPPTLAPGEIALNFAILGGGPGFAVEQQWQDIAQRFADQDPEVGYVHIQAENQNQFASIVGNYDCLYAGTNLVPDADLTQLLSLDPLLSSDPDFNPDDFIRGVFDQVKVNNQTWALPVEISPLVLRFDYDTYTQAGVTPPDGSWTVSQFEDSIRQIQPTLPADETAVQLNNSGQTSLLVLIAVYGGIPFDPRTDPPTIDFTNPTTVDAIQQVLDLVKGGYIDYAAGGGGGGGFGGPTTAPIYSNILNAFSFGGFGGGGGGFGGNQAQNSDGITTFPLGTQYNAVPFNLGTTYISAATQHADACYRFMMFLSDSTDVFQSMPVRYSQIASSQLLAARGEENVAFFQSLSDLMGQPSTLLIPTNLNAGTFGMTNWLFGVFDRYLNDETVDLTTDLQQAQQITQDYLTCVAGLPTFDPSQGDFQSFFQQINQCRTLADPSAASS